MPVNRELKVIYVHIPKTAGTSIEIALNIYGKYFEPSTDLVFGKFEINNETYALQHISMQQLQEFGFLNSETGKDYFKFAFVRNPWDRAVSDFIWQTKVRGFKGSFHHYLLKAKQLINENPTRNITAQNCHFVPQSWYIYNQSHELLVDYVGRFEKLNTHFRMVCSKTGINDIRLKRTNRYRLFQIPYPFYYNPTTYAMVKEIYADDILKFGYTFLKGRIIK